MSYCVEHGSAENEASRVSHDMRLDSQIVVDFVVSTLMNLRIQDHSLVTDLDNS